MSNRNHKDIRPLTVDFKSQDKNALNKLNMTCTLLNK